ncbi:hypothetical protein TIFTF001_055653 [Ficus carica]|uniref:Uncharacterized protein n=1 Tax=Ficus carica TaxID=3494 RepID=A0AA88EDV9_FICCA|nr:hypothetical protein TIFTF001_055653 [Ficus carica]
MDSEVILSIPLGRSNCPDNLIWHYDSRGLYTIKIAETDAVRLAFERSKWSGSHPCYLSA